jgi:hypothetical protein
MVAFPISPEDGTKRSSFLGLVAWLLASFPVGKSARKIFRKNVLRVSYAPS